MTAPTSFASKGRLAALVVACLLSACAGHFAHRDALRLLEEGKVDEGVARLREAHAADPGNPRFEIDLLRHQALQARELVVMGDRARAADVASEAVGYYQRALRAEPGNPRAAAGLAAVQDDQRRVQQLAEVNRLTADGKLDAARTLLRQVLARHPQSVHAMQAEVVLQAAQDRVDQARAQVAEAQSLMAKAVTLQFRDANLRMVFEALSRTTGLNVVLDRDVRADLKTTIFVRDATLESTLDMILMQNQLSKRMLNATSLLIYPTNPGKQRDYQDLQLRTFHINNADPKYLQTLLKGVLKLKEVSVDDRTGLLVIRDTVEAIAVASKLIAAHDVPDAEVMLEVEVLEVSRDRASSLGLKLPDAVTLGVPNAAAATGGMTLGGLRSLSRNDLTVSQLAATLNLKLLDSDTNLLASPRIRTRNREKARILIGDRVPTITNSVTPVQTGQPVITGNVTYQEVGLKLEVEPQIYDDMDVGIRINLEVSNIAREFTDPQGGRSYQIGTRNAQTTLRLRDGETQIIGGLISDQDRNTASKIPGLGHLPIAGRLFGSNDGGTSKTEIVLSITPRIIRAPALDDPALRDIYSGTEAGLRERPVRLDSVGDIRLPDGMPSGTATGGTSPAGGAMVLPNGMVLPGASGNAPLNPGAAATTSNASSSAEGELSPAQQLRNMRRPPVVPYRGGQSGVGPGAPSESAPMPSTAPATTPAAAPSPVPAVTAPMPPSTSKGTDAGTGTAPPPPAPQRQSRLHDELQRPSAKAQTCA